MGARLHPPPETRRTLLSRIKNWEDKDSWQQFYDIYSPLIFGAALAAGLSHVEAEEVLQETIFTVAKQLRAENGETPSFKYDPEIGSFKGWLMNTTRWKITDQFRKRGPLVHHSPKRASRTDRTPTEAKIPDPNAEMEPKWDREYKETIQEAALEKVKGKIKAKHFQVYDLYVLKQLPTQKVARLLGMNAGQVFVVKCRILALLKKEVQRIQREIL